MGKFEPIIDKLLGLTISKKLTVFLIACIFAYFDKLSGEQWVQVAFYYIVAQGSLDGLKELKKFLEIYKNNSDGSNNN